MTSNAALVRRLDDLLADRDWADDRETIAREALAVVALAILLQRSRPSDWTRLYNKAADRALDFPDLGAAADMLEHTRDDLNDTVTTLLSGFRSKPVPERLNELVRVLGLELAADTQHALTDWFDRVLDRTFVSPTSGIRATPPGLADMMARLARLGDGDHVLDPACGVGSLLRAATRRAKHLSLDAQEINADDRALAVLRFALSGQPHVNIRSADALRAPASAADGHLQQFDRVVCRSPLGRRASRLDHDPWQRFMPGGTAMPFAESLFLQHAMASLKSNGRAVFHTSYGQLFRSGYDARLRQQMIERNFVDVVIGLPKNTIPHVSIETALLVLVRDGPNERKHGRVLMVDAAQPNRSDRLSLEDLTEFVLARTALPGTATEVDASQIAANNWSLQPGRYLHGASTAEPDPTALWNDAEAARATAGQAAENLADLLKKLQLDITNRD
jgi:SAM-dependent methyltransferase